MINPHRLYTLKQAAVVLNTSVLTLQRMAAAGEFRSGDKKIPIKGVWVKVGARWRVPGWWLLQLIGGEGEPKEQQLYLLDGVEDEPAKRPS